MAIKPTIEERLDNIEHILDTTNGYKPVKTIKEIAKGTAMGTANLAQELSNWKFEIDKKFDKICEKIDHMEINIKKLDGYMERLIDIIKSWK